jgi:two-component system chemotaxis response regulator CheY
VDDEEDVRKVVRLTLNRAGYDVVEAEDGACAIATIKAGDNPLMIDAVVCDIRMPKVNGVEAIEYLRAQFPSVPVVVMTGHPDVTCASELFKRGVADYLEKPMTPATLTAAVHRVAKDHVYKDPFKA